MLSVLFSLVFAEEDIVNKIFEKIPVLKQDIDRLAGKLPINDLDLKEKEKVLQKIQDYVRNGEPIFFTFVGFAFKSTYASNTVLGKNPDMAEYLSLQKLNQMCLNIQKIYPFGAKVIIYTDGIAFCKSFNISYQEVEEYENGLKTLCKNFKFLSVVTPHDLMPGHSYKELDKIIEKYQPSYISELDQIDYRVRLDREVDRSMSEKTRQSITVSVLKKRSAFARWIQPYRTKSILLSCHYKHNIGEKIGISLSNSVWTPWHGCAVKKNNGAFEIMPKRYAPKNATQHTKIINGLKCPFLKEK